MSEEAAVVEAPAVTPEAEAPATPEAPPTPAAVEHPEPGNESAKTRQRRIMQDRVRAADASRARALEQPREDAGTPEGGEFKTEAEAPETEPTAEAATDEVPAEPEATAAELPAPVAVSDEKDVAADPAPTPETVMIPLSENHPFRSRGITEWATSPELETETRGMLNAVERQSGAQATADDLREQNMMLEARLKAQQGEMPYQKSPEDEFLLQEIREKYSPEKAAQVEAAFESLNTQHMHQAEQQATQMVAERRIASAFIANVKTEAAQRLPVWETSGEIVGHVGRLLDQYGEHVDSRNEVLGKEGRQIMPPTAQEFFQWIAPVYANDPRVQQGFKDEQTRNQKASEERIRAEERATFAKAETAKLAEAATRHGTRPPSTSSHSSSGTVAGVEADEARRTAHTGSNRRTATRKNIAARYAGR